MPSIITTTKYTRPSVDVDFFLVDPIVVDEIDRLMIDGTITMKKTIDADDGLTRLFETEFPNKEAYLAFKSNAIILDMAESRNEYNEANGITKEGPKIEVQYLKDDAEKINIDELFLE